MGRQRRIPAVISVGQESNFAVFSELVGGDSVFVNQANWAPAD